MAHFDLPLDELRSFKPDLAVPADFDAFWARTLDELRAHPLGVRRQRIETGMRTVETHDVSFAGWGGARIAAWLVLPAHREPGFRCRAWSSTSATPAVAVCHMSA